MFLFLFVGSGGGSRGGAHAAGTAGDPVGDRGWGTSSTAEGENGVEGPGETSRPTGEQLQGPGPVIGTEQQKTTGGTLNCALGVGMFGCLTCWLNYNLKAHNFRNNAPSTYSCVLQITFKIFKTHGWGTDFHFIPLWTLYILQLARLITAILIMTCLHPIIASRLQHLNLSAWEHISTAAN